MPNRTSYTEGTPCMVDLQTTDQDGAKAFYGQLLGWQYDDQPMPQGPVYSMALKDGGVVAAIAPQSPQMISQKAPPAWNTYIAVDDVDAAAGKAESAGGQVLMAPFDVMDAGRMAFVCDPSGAVVGLWQANQHIGATLVNEPCSLIWNELITDNGDAALPFYQSVLGLEQEQMDMGGMSYTLLKTKDGAQVAGSMPTPMEGVPNHWHVYFAVDDIGAATDKVKELGGAIVNGPFQTPVGEMTVVSDPQGAVFTLMQPAAHES